jgi:hypothetical protein
MMSDQETIRLVAPTGPTAAQERDIGNLESRVGSLKRELADALNLLHRRKCEAWGLTIGKTVLREKKTGALGLLADASAFMNASAPWVIIHPAKKDGSFGNSVRHWYGDWEIASPIVSTESEDQANG